jgi:hypothetical protein
VDLALAGAVSLLLAVVAFRRARGVLTPTARRAAAREAIGTRTRRAVTVVLTVARAAVGVAALMGIVWLTRELFR